MKLETTAAQIRSALHILKGVVGRRNTTPVLGTVKFENGQLTGTNLDIEATVALPSIGSQEGTAAIDYFGLAAIAHHIARDETVMVAEEQGIASLSFNGSTYRMPSYPVADFPVFGTVDGPRSSAGNLGLVNAMRRVRFAISTEETRYYLNGVAIVGDREGRPLVAATDGHRLAMLPLPSAPDGSIGKIIPSHLVHLVCRGGIEPDAVIFDEKLPRARFELPGLTISAKLIDGTFPDIFRVVPSSPQPAFSVDRAQLLPVLLRLRAFAYRRAGVKLEADGSHLKLTMSHLERQATEIVPLAAAMTPFSAGFNLDYLVDALSVFRGDTVTFAAEGEASGRPNLMTCTDDPLTIILMPMRV
ncbi:DNA polymerase III subunit beta [Chelativorans oligotrophicus]|uniref:DNA polymerase III subunit beta n=1 Tax=Chelativorans oligotrophicus TaxID=449974 RepID=UPI00140867DA|nr:hypothetical protein [Chelativorans oligotrophicus]